MKRIPLACSLFFALALFPTSAWSAGTLQRYALVVGANFGGADRPQLLYAVSDAERFARVLIELGGVTPANDIVLRQPTLRDLTDALDAHGRFNQHIIVEGFSRRSEEAIHASNLHSAIRSASAMRYGGLALIAASICGFLYFGW